MWETTCLYHLHNLSEQQFENSFVDISKNMRVISQFPSVRIPGPDPCKITQEIMLRCSQNELFLSRKHKRE